MTPTELQDRLKKFAFRVVNVTESMPGSILSKVIKSQILRSAFSGAENYRSACSGYTKKMFNSKLAIALEEVDESVFWLEVIADVGLIKPVQMKSLIQEGEELTKILAASLTSRKG